jgi:serine/threonine protein kinase
MNYKFLVSIFSLLLLFLGCGPDQKGQTQQDPTKAHQFESDHIKAEQVNGAWVYTIKSPIINKVVFIKSDGSEIIDDLEKLENNDINSISYILFPYDHWFIKDNPFLALSSTINLKRRLVWDKELKFLKTEQSSVLLKVAEDIKSPALKQVDPQTLFPNFQTHVLGQGGVGTVYRVTWQGIDYALKMGALEYAHMERLFFTGGVLEIFGYFKHNNAIYMIMPLAINSLQDKIDNNEQFILGAEDTQKLVKLLEASNALTINNADIKPDNIVITQDGPKLIDINSASTEGYAGTAGIKLLHALLEGLTHKSFRGGSVSLDRYYDFDQDYRDNNIASPDYLKYFFTLVCMKENISNNCDTVTTYDGLFALLPLQTLNTLALEMDQQWKDHTGTKDQDLMHGGLYGTMLDYPRLKDDANRDYQAYFNQKAIIVTGFCKTIHKIAQTITHIGKNYFFSKLLTQKPSYSNRCADDPNNPGTPLLLSEFNNYNTQNFKDFVMDAFEPIVQLNSFIRIAINNDDRTEVFKLILEKEAASLNLAVGLKTALKTLLQL